MITNGAWIEYIPLSETNPHAEKKKGTKHELGSPAKKLSHSSLSADVFLRSGAGNIFNPRPCNSLQYINVTPPVLLRLPAENWTFLAYITLPR